MNITPSKFWIGETPGEFVPGRMIDLRLVRGFGYHTFKLVCREGWRCDTELEAKKNPISIKLECAAEIVSQKTQLEFENWHILSRRALEWGWVEYEIADHRWLHRHNKLTAQYNIVSYGNKRRKDSLYAASRPWTCIEAANAALRDLGFDVVVDPKLPAHLNTIQLPDNLGDFAGGGFMGASLQEFGPLLLEPVRCDIVPTLDGKLLITDRVREASKDLKGYIHIGGQIRAANVKWQKPKKLRHEFAKRIERRWEFTEGTAAANALSPAIENVAPKWDADHPDDSKGFIVFGDANEPDSFIALLNARLGSFDTPLTVAGIKSLFMAPSIYDTTRDNQTAEQVAKLMVAESLVRENWRRTFRVKVSSTSIDDIRARWARPEIGRLQADGTNKAEGAVFMDYVVDLRFGQRRAGEHPFEAAFSENIRYSFSTPAPFTAKWLDRGELIFQIAGNGPSFYKRGYLPGQLRGRGKHYGEWDKVKRGAKLALDSNVDFNDSFRLAVYWHALYMGPPVGYTGPQYARSHIIEKTLFEDGDVESLTLRCDSLIANFAYDGTFPGSLLNGSELEEETRRVVREVKDALTQGRAGPSRHGGVDVLAKGKFTPQGDIHEVAVIIGQRSASSIDTHITVMPGARLLPKPVFTREPGQLAEAIL